MLAYLSRCTHRVAISNRPLIAFDQNGLTFKYKDYRADGRARCKLMTLATDEFIRRFLVHFLPNGFQPQLSSGSTSWRPSRYQEAESSKSAAKPGRDGRDGWSRASS